MLNTLSSITSQPWFIIVMLLAIFGIIVIAVILVKKYSKHFKSDEKPKSDREIAEEEVNRILVDIEEDDEAKKEMEEASKKIKKKSKEIKPSEEEILQDEMNRTVEPVEDAKALEAMDEYAKNHPEEAETAIEESEKEGK